MGEKRWVQHISGQGEKWEVQEEYGDTQWKVVRIIPKASQKIGMTFHYLPKSEYRLCETPERWERVECDVQKGANWGIECTVDGLCVAVVQLHNKNAYRVVSVVLEKKVPQ